MSELLEAESFAESHTPLSMILLVLPLVASTASLVIPDSRMSPEEEETALIFALLSEFETVISPDELVEAENVLLTILLKKMSPDELL